MKHSELTIRGLLLGAVIAAVFTAANVYLGLKVAITIASSIPAAVISMGVLRAFKTGSIRENNIVQTVASAGGTLSSIVFVLPGLVMLGYWNGFPFWSTFLVCALGGVLGVMFSIPLRRALVVNTTLPFPEGVAAAEVLKVGATGDEASPNALERDRGPLIVLWAAVIAAAMQIVTFTGVAAGAFTKYFRVGVGAAGSIFDFQFTLALVGAGHLVGLSVGIAQLVGVLVCWAWFVPMWTAVHAPGDVATVVDEVWHRVRYVGAGAIGVAAIWSLLKLVRPVVGGMMATLAARKAAKGASGAYDDRDIPGVWIAGLSVASLVGVGGLLWQFMQNTPLAAMSLPLVVGGVVFVVVIGFFVATVAGYMAALIGASNSPVSGIGILSALAGASLLAAFVAPSLGASATQSMVAFCLFAVAIVFTVSTISNDNLQDLKTGQLVGASPWKQQVALLVGVVAGSLVIPLVLNVLNHSNGFPGDPNRHAVNEALSAPQATLISSIATGVLNGKLPWSDIFIGMGLGAAFVVIDEVLGALKLMRLPPLAIGIGIYLPMSATLPVTLGAVLGWFYNRNADKKPNAEMIKRFGVLMASGLIVGESLLGVLNAAVVAATDKQTPFALPFTQTGFADMALLIGTLLFIALTAWVYRWTGRQALTKS